MNASSPSNEYLVISRGQWDPEVSKERIQQTIDDFYLWIESMVAEGKMKTGQRLAHTGKTVSRHGITDGPFGETKEIIGGYWFVVANSLEEAAEYMQGNPTIQLGLAFELRPLELERASAYRASNENGEG